MSRILSRSPKWYDVEQREKELALMQENTNAVISIAKPQAGTETQLSIQEGGVYVLDFSLDSAMVDRSGPIARFAFDDGSEITFSNFFSVAEKGDFTIELPDGTQLSGHDVAAILNLNPQDFQTDAPADSSGFLMAEGDLSVPPGAFLEAEDSPHPPPPHPVQTPPPAAWHDEEGFSALIDAGGSVAAPICTNACDISDEHPLANLPLPQHPAEPDTPASAAHAPTPGSASVPDISSAHETVGNTGHAEKKTAEPGVSDAPEPSRHEAEPAAAPQQEKSALPLPETSGNAPAKKLGNASEEAPGAASGETSGNASGQNAPGQDAHEQGANGHTTGGQSADGTTLRADAHSLLPHHDDDGLISARIVPNLSGPNFSGSSFSGAHSSGLHAQEERQPLLLEDVLDTTPYHGIPGLPPSTPGMAEGSLFEALQAELSATEHVAEGYGALHTAGVYASGNIATPELDPFFLALLKCGPE